MAGAVGKASTRLYTLPACRIYVGSIGCDDCLENLENLEKRKRARERESASHILYAQEEGQGDIREA